MLRAIIRRFVGSLEKINQKTFPALISRDSQLDILRVKAPPFPPRRRAESRTQIKIFLLTYILLIGRTRRPPQSSRPSYVQSGMKNLPFVYHIPPSPSLRDRSILSSRLIPRSLN